MALDPPTLLLTMLLVVSMTGAGCWLVWLQDRRQEALLWMGLAVLFIALAMAGRAALAFMPGVIFATSGLLLGFGLIWTAFRALNNHPPEPAVIFLPILIWLGLCFSPAFRTHMALRISLGIFLSLIPLSLAMGELWRTRLNAQILRRAVLLVMAAEILLLLQRAVRSLIWPHVVSARFEAAPGFKVLMLDLMGFILILGASIIALAQDQTVRWYRDHTHNDLLTGLSNRKYFEACLRRHIQRAQYEAAPLALILLSIEGLASATDARLRPLAEAITAACRPSDLVGRYRANEFAVLLPLATPQDAMTVAARLRQRVTGLHLAHSTRPGEALTVSQGIAVLSAPSLPMKAIELTAMADRALGCAEQEGGGVCWTADGQDLHAVPPLPA